MKKYITRNYENLANLKVDERLAIDEATAEIWLKANMCSNLLWDFLNRYMQDETTRQDLVYALQAHSDIIESQLQSIQEHLNEIVAMLDECKTPEQMLAEL